MENILYLLPGFGILGLLFVVWKSAWVAKQEVGTDKMKKISDHIAEGAMAFLKAEYKVLAIFVVCVALLLGFTADSESISPTCRGVFCFGCILFGAGRFYRYARCYQSECENYQCRPYQFRQST